MKTTNPALTSAAGHGILSTLRSALNGECVLLTELLGKPSTYLDLASAAVCSTSAAASILLASDGLREYGWAAFFMLLAVCAGKPLYQQIKK